jgi:hypothetical protein|tara:strand:- start:348 stop:530 length:183 start_codon:yes stop_codon:yes gene_type:complete
MRFNEKMKVVKTVLTVNGTLYKDEIVKFQEIEENGDYRVKDSTGKIWFIDKKNLKGNKNE